MAHELHQRKRAAWIDNARGFIIFNTALSTFMPHELRERLGFFMRPSDDIAAHHVTYYDLGMSGFILLMGITLPLYLQQRIKSYGATRAYLQLTARALILITMGIAFRVFQVGEPLIRTIDDKEQWIGCIPLLSWDSLSVLGAASLVTLPLVRLSYWARTAVALVLLTSYQYLLTHGGWSHYAGDGHLGLQLASFFSFPTLMIFGSIIGETLHNRDLMPDRRYIRNLLLVGIGSGCASWALAHYFHIYPNRQLATANLMVLGICIGSLYLSLFLILERVWGKPIPLISSYGKNTFVAYAMYIEAIWLLWYLKAQSNYLLFGLGFSAMCAIILFLDRRKLILQV